ncbi:hypothetical protein ACFL4W_03070 [Planctomycetota bacterium]
MERGRVMEGEQEYILLDEAEKVTGLTAKTLKEKLRGKVPMIGHNAYFRADFFSYWRQQATANKKKKTDRVLEALLQN